MPASFINSRRIILLIPIVIIVLFFACNTKEENPKTGLNDELNFSLSDYELILKGSLLNSNSSNILFQSLNENLDTIKFFYSTKYFKPLFIKSFESKIFVDSLLNILGNSYEHGLNPERYHFTLIKNEFYESIKANQESSERYVHLANTELLVADALLNYSTHMRHGAINPREIYPDSYFLPVKDSLNKLLFEPLRQNDIIQYLYNIQPKSDKYKKWNGL